MIDIQYLRQFKLLGYAIFDLTLSFIGILLISPLLRKVFQKAKVDIPTISWIYLTLPIGILVHLVAGNHTPMTEQFINPHSNYTLKIIIIVLLILGIKHIKKHPHSAK